MSEKDDYSTPFEQGQMNGSFLANPYWLNYPKRSTPEDETAARQYVSGVVASLRTS